MTVVAPAHRTRRPAAIGRTGERIRALPRRRVLQMALGLLWLVDAALQFQPYMFTKAFVTETLASTAAGNPTVVAAPITWVSGVLIHHIGVYDAVFASLQLALAVGLLWRPTVRIALGASIAWSILVWWFGEGLGGVLTGATSPFMGAPGGVILYAFVAVLVWPSDGPGPGESVATSGPLGAAGPRALWLALWASSAYFVLQPDQRGPQALGSMVRGMGSGEPGWLAGVDRALGTALAGRGTEVCVTVALLCAFAGFSVLLPRLTRAGVAVAAVVAAAIWVAEDFGAILTGHGTDPNSGLALILVAATFWPVARRPATWDNAAWTSTRR